MKLKDWYLKRGPKFIYQRGASLLDRYNLSPDQAMRRIERCVASLAKQGCSPTFPTPAVLVQRYPKFIRCLQDEGAEIAVHGYHHVNLNAYPIEQAYRQLEKAARIFQMQGIRYDGFRCPYMGCCDEMIDSLPAGLFGYSSNQAVRWPAPSCEEDKSGNILYNTVAKFYRPWDSAETACVPWTRSNMIEIPVSTPDDLQLLDGLQLGRAGLSLAWQHMLQQTYQRGELFTLLFHTELAELCERPFIELMQTARNYQPAVWVAKLAEICKWWKEKEAFRVQVIPQSNSLCLSFQCTRRATILARGLQTVGLGPRWHGTYTRLQSHVIEIPEDHLPFVGLPDNVSKPVLSFLREQGYIVEVGEKAARCKLYLDRDTLSGFTNHVQLVDYLETYDAPLIRFGRWPDGARSALAITGDLDALSLLDYASRLFSSEPNHRS